MESYFKCCKEFLKIFKIESHVFQAGLELTVYPRMILNFWATYCHLVSSVIRGMCHHGQFYVYTANLLPKHAVTGIFTFFKNLINMFMYQICILYKVCWGLGWNFSEIHFCPVRAKNRGRTMKTERALPLCLSFSNKNSHHFNTGTNWILPFCPWLPGSSEIHIWLSVTVLICSH